MIRTAPFSLPLSRPMTTADGRIDRRRGILVGVGFDGLRPPRHPTRDGATGAGSARGVGEATPLAGWTEPFGACRDALAGLDGADDAAATLADGRLDGTPAARHAGELALLDAEARAAGRPLAAVLAGGDREPAAAIPANAVVGDGDPESTANEAADAVERGYGCVKLKAGARAWPADRERVAATREAVGGSVTLRVDANGAWDVSTARSAVEWLGGLGVEYVEQPLPADRPLAEFAALRGGGVGIALDESLLERSVGEVVDAGAADVAVLKPMALGGPLRARLAAERARAGGVDPVVTTTVDAAVARTAAVHLAATVPDPRACGLGTAGRLERDLGDDPAPVVDGRVRVPDGPGIAGESFDGLIARE